MSDNRKLYSLLDTLRRTAVFTGNVALGGAYLAEQKAEDIWKTAKLRLEANRLEDEISERLQDVGEYVYATHAGSPSDSDEMHETLQEIDHLKSKLDGLNKQIGRKPEALECPFCGADVQVEDRYCRECGEGLFEESQEESREESRNEEST